MPTFLRIGIKEERWFPDDSPWLGRGDVPADAMRDLGTKGNTLSVFEIAEDVDIQRVIAAWWAVGDHNDKPVDVGFALFDIDRVRRLGVKLSRTEGRTADPEVDRWHMNIEELTAARLADLAAVIADGDTNVVLGKDLAAALKKGLDERRFDRERINRKLVERLS